MAGVASAFRTYFGGSASGLVDMRTFICSPDYMNMSGIYPYWLNWSKAMRPDTEFVGLSGSLGGGKSTMAALLTCYKFYYWFSQGDLYRYFGIMRGSPLYYLYFSTTMRQAERSGFKQLRNMIDSAPWFLNNYPRRKEIQSSIQFGNGLSVEFASGESHAIGLNVVGGILDEANFRNGVGNGTVSEYSEVQQLAQQLEDRLSSRFAYDGGKLKSFFCYVSSASFSSSFMEQKLDELRDRPRSLVNIAVQYKIQPEKHSKKKFEVFCGYHQLSPALIQSPEHKQSLLDAMGLPKKQAQEYFEMVPDDLLPSFKKNLMLAIQNHCGRSTASKGTFVTNYEVVAKSYSSELLAARPLYQDSIVVSDRDDVEIWSILDESKFADTDKPHALTVDLSLTGDHASMCLVRYDGLSAERRPEHSVVFVLDLIPPQYPGMLKISKVKYFILWLAERFNIVAFSADNFQSAQLRQDVSEELGLPDIRFSVDSSDVPHLLWLSMLIDKRLRMQYIPRLDAQIRDAVHDVGKHKVLKRDAQLGDDMFQVVVAASFLSETVCTAGGDLSELLDARVNLCGEASIRRLCQQLGYMGISFDSRGKFTQVKQEGYQPAVLDLRAVAASRRAGSQPEAPRKVSMAELAAARSAGGVRSGGLTTAALEEIRQRDAKRVSRGFKTILENL